MASYSQQFFGDTSASSRSSRSMHPIGHPPHPLTTPASLSNPRNTSTSTFYISSTPQRPDPFRYVLPPPPQTNHLQCPDTFFYVFPSSPQINPSLRADSFRYMLPQSPHTNPPMPHTAHDDEQCRSVHHPSQYHAQSPFLPLEGTSYTKPTGNRQRGDSATLNISTSGSPGTESDGDDREGSAADGDDSPPQISSAKASRRKVSAFKRITGVYPEQLLEFFITESPSKRLLAQQIYDRFQNRFPELGATTNLERSHWQANIWDALRTRNRFVEIPRPPGQRGRGNYWTVDTRFNGRRPRNRPSNTITAPEPPPAPPAVISVPTTARPPPPRVFFESQDLNSRTPPRVLVMPRLPSVADLLRQLSPCAPDSPPHTSELPTRSQFLRPDPRLLFSVTTPMAVVRSPTDDHRHQITILNASTDPSRSTEPREPGTSEYSLQIHDGGY